MQRVAETHPPEHRRGDALGIRHGFVGRHIVGQIVLADTAKGPHQRAQTTPCAFTTVAMNLANAIAIVIARPFLQTVADAGVARLSGYDGGHIAAVGCR